ncbi:MAG: 16S rRNA (uracil(1498)-N(3))-methyltransferase [Bacteroidaceae bacterium]|nr:16S rRNA (uracil(1498)-N(3))-methyltransferase [Bacteroidaceae bacterium]
MKELHIFYAPEIEQTHELPQEEAAHAVRVLRMKEGDNLVATDGKGKFYDCTITLASNKSCRININSVETPSPLWHGKIHLAVAPTKNMDRTEWLAEKATEIGVDQFSFLLCDNSERKVIKTERVEKIVVSATKQSHKATKPKVEELIPFKKFISQDFKGQKFIAHCYDDIPGTDNVKPFLGDVLSATDNALVMIGPEGDFSISEVQQALQAGFIPIHLGRSRLRTETAGLVAVHLMYIKKMTE